MSFRDFLCLRFDTTENIVRSSENADVNGVKLFQTRTSLSYENN